MSGPALAAIVGATGTGKTALAVALAEKIGGEIVSCDSAQIYRGLDVGTASPTREERDRAPHHLIDVLEPTEQWSAAEFAAAADRAIADIRTRGRVPIVVGGNGLWYRALVKGIFSAPAIDESLRAEVREEVARRGPEAMHAELMQVDPTAAARIQPRDPQRIGRALEVYRQTGVPISVLQDAHGFREARYQISAIALDWNREELRAHLAVRVQRMFSGGLLEEVESCLSRGVPREAPGLRTIGYREGVSCVQGLSTRESAEAETLTNTRRYAKRQRNWFRHEPEVQWLPRGVSVPQVLDRLRTALRGV